MGGYGGFLDITDEEWAAFVERMKAFRKRYGLTQARLAKELGVKRETVSRCEELFQRPYPRTVMAFARMEERYRQAEELEMQELEGLS